MHAIVPLTRIEKKRYHKWCNAYNSKAQSNYISAVSFWNYDDEVLQFDTIGCANFCAKYGVTPFQRVRTDEGTATILGCAPENGEYKLWIVRDSMTYAESVPDDYTFEAINDYNVNIVLLTALCQLNLDMFFIIRVIENSALWGREIFDTKELMDWYSNQYKYNKYQCIPKRFEKIFTLCPEAREYEFYQKWKPPGMVQLINYKMKLKESDIAQNYKKIDRNISTKIQNPGIATLRKLCCDTLCAYIRRNVYDKQSLLIIINEVSKLDSSTINLISIYKAAAPLLVEFYSSSKHFPIVNELFMIARGSISIFEILAKEFFSLYEYELIVNEEYVAALDFALDLNIFSLIAVVEGQVFKAPSGSYLNWLIDIWGVTLNNHERVNEYCVEKLRRYDLLELYKSNRFICLSEERRSLFEQSCILQVVFKKTAIEGYDSACFLNEDLQDVIHSDVESEEFSESEDKEFSEFSN